ncbi:hypothetical protein CGQ20_28380, partial [Klebsiella pneumoniae]
MDRQLVAGCKRDRAAGDQRSTGVSQPGEVIRDAWQNAACEEISMECRGLAAIQACQSGRIEVKGEKSPALRGNRLSAGPPLTVHHGEVPARRPGPAFWQQPGFQFANVRPAYLVVGRPRPHMLR